VGDQWGDDIPDVTGDGPAPDQRPTTALMGFASGGLVGLFQALDESEDDTEGGLVEDPEALRRAEEAVAHDPELGHRGAHIDEPLVTVAVQDGPGGTAGLEDVGRALESEGIDFGWDPFDPREQNGFALYPGATRRAYSIVVPRSQAARAREVLYGTPPAGVSYAWAKGVPRPAPDAASGQDTEYGFGPDGLPSPRPVTGVGPAMSDNDRLERMASGGPTIEMISMVLVIAALIVGILTILTQR